jgi:hypothetical protein
MLTGKNITLPGRMPPDRRKGKGSYVRAVGSFVPKLTGKVFEKYGFHTAEIMTNWATVAGADVAQWSEPERIRWPRAASVETEDNAKGREGATLVLRVDPARALDIEYRAKSIIEHINRYFGYKAVETLKIVQAPLTRQLKVAEASFTVPARVPPDVPAPVAGISDPGLQTALSALWASISRAKPPR